MGHSRHKTAGCYVGGSGAAVLVRLARGLSMPNSDGMEVEEARALTDAMKAMVRRLRALILVVLGTMILLVALPAIAGKVVADFYLTGWHADTVLRASSALVGCAIAYCLVRMVQVVTSDVGLVDIQADALMKSLARKQATKFEEGRTKGTVAPFKTPEGWGKKIS